MIYELKKRYWTDIDFAEMGWHDSCIYKISCQGDLAMDIDYIVKWNMPDVAGLPFTFWVAPATLVFKNISNLSFNFSPCLEDCFQIDDISFEQNDRWIIDTQRGYIEFDADGYEMFIRQEPSYQFSQTIPAIERGDHSIDKTIAQETPNRTREDVLQRRQRNMELYDMVKKRRLKKIELEELIRLREHNEIDTKPYLLKKRELNELLFSYNYYLKDTDFRDWG